MYAVSSRAPATWGYGVGATGRWAHSAYWRMNAVANYAYSRFSVIGADVQSTVVATEEGLIEAVHTADMHYPAVLASDGLAAAEAYLTNVSVSNADAVTDKWATLWTSLFVKYRDGLVVSPPTPPAHPKDLPPPPDCTSPGYDTAWLARVIKDTGNRYLIPQSSDALATHELRKRALMSKR
jgi:hypothetical protein